ncbi:DUF2884 domain-containing protein [uncultured Cedecea sp.]|uniref:DUF2884 domain-containing protein n=1 Tax=uncultured Cedecea sp. TaxID=988762 RepID=UPI002603E53E|nr:DUF2884 domain-containing protein [uncultured Cedecea sp.]
MFRQALLGALLVTAASAQANYQCRVNPQDDVVITPQSVQVVGKNGDLVIAPNGNVQFNGVAKSLNTTQRQQAVNYQQALRTDLPWIDNGARQRVDQGRIALDRIIAKEVGENSNMRGRLTKLDSQLKEQMNRIIEHRPDGLTFHYQAIEQVRSQGQQLVNQAMGAIVQDSINEMGAKAVMGGGNPLQNVLGNLGGLQTAVQSEWKSQEADFQKFGRDVCNKVVSLEEQRKALVSTLN